MSEIELAIDMGSLTLLTKAIEYGGDVNMMRCGMPLIHRALLKCEEHMVRPNLDEPGPLHYLECFEYLCKHADINIVDKRGMTVLHIAALLTRQHTHPGTNYINIVQGIILSTLIDVGAKLDTKDNNGIIPYHYMPLSYELEPYPEYCKMLNVPIKSADKVKLVNFTGSLSADK